MPYPDGVAASVPVEGDPREPTLCGAARSVPRPSRSRAPRTAAPWPDQGEQRSLLRPGRAGRQQLDDAHRSRRPGWRAALPPSVGREGSRRRGRATRSGAMVALRSSPPTAAIASIVACRTSARRIHEQLLHRLRRFRASIEGHGDRGPHRHVRIVCDGPGGVRQGGDIDDAEGANRRGLARLVGIGQSSEDRLDERGFAGKRRQAGEGGVRTPGSGSSSARSRASDASGEADPCRSARRPSDGRRVPMRPARRRAPRRPADRDRARPGPARPRAPARPDRHAAFRAGSSRTTGGLQSRRPSGATAVAAPSQKICSAAKRRPAPSSRRPDSIMPTCPGTPSTNARTCARRSAGMTL